MLIEFRVANHRSLRDEQVLTMEAGRVGDDDDPRPRKVAGHAKKLLTVAALYGANASGKSNVLSALAFMREAVLTSHRLWPPDRAIPRQPFAWGPRAAEASMYEIAILIGETRYQYGFAATDECIVEEWLYAWPKGKKQAWFARDGDRYRFSGQLKGENQLIRSITRKNALFLSAAAQHNHPQLAGVYSWFHSLLALGTPSDFTMAEQYDPHGIPRQGPTRGFAAILDMVLFSSSKPFKKAIIDSIRTMLGSADLGVLDLRILENGGNGSSSGVQLKHQSASGDAWLPLEQESSGTRRMFDLAWPLLTTIRTGGVLIVDELEASLHPLLAQRIVEQFNDPDTNPRNAQLILATHDTNLLGTNLGGSDLRRDQIWLTEKDEDGATVLYPLTDFKPGPDENLERGYLQGRYGAIPFLLGLTATGE